MLKAAPTVERTMTQMRFAITWARSFMIATFLFIGACKGPSDERGGRADGAIDSSQAQGGLGLSASAFVDSVYRVHLAADGGFGHETLLARRSWFTPTLFDLLDSEMGGPEIGLVNFDPLVGSQESPSHFALGEITVRGDSTIVDVEVSFGTGANGETKRVAAYLVSGQGTWRIANLVSNEVNLLEYLHTAYSAANLETGLDASCDFKKRTAHINPRALVDEFARLAASGTFSEAESWLPLAVDCPGHEPGYDTFDVVSHYSVVELDAGDSTARYLLRRSVLGQASGGSFARDRSERTDTVILCRTGYGWRIKTPAPWNWIHREDALRRQWIEPADTGMSQ